ncbi:fumarylacetoacetate hydrolase family protein [Oxalobacter vibrioformis]|uniref:Fumarylacetoacetate hydrolase family protein n=1 Tax=Oxalobacter vibrioformis TaxID=933080 RepID=A0A9E9P417_9BURK|nr:fumarylacetoacetate hydrolase family protein [Oxalobacter vibrioformis]WAW09676.1 fumarylacetoacetate hydrolase family protein [Oxalobacter vibrioformis]
MKLVRYGHPGKEKPGLIDESGNIRDLSGVIDDFTAGQLSDTALARIAAMNHASLPLVSGNPRLGVPVAHVGKYIAIGINYIEHAKEANMRLPKEPIVFMKAVTCLCGATDNIILPKDSKKSDWEIELGVIIGRKAQYITEEEALDHVAGYCVANDLSEREFQIERGTQWDKGKGCDTFGPVGPWLVTRDEVPDPQNLDMYLDVNGVRMQTGNTRTMIFSVAKIVSYLSHFMTLLPGDIIATGTPPGVGMGREPQLFLKPGDNVRAGIAGLSEQNQDVIAWSRTQEVPAPP